MAYTNDMYYLIFSAKPLPYSLSDHSPKAILKLKEGRNVGGE